MPLKQASFAEILAFYGLVLWPTNLAKDIEAVTAVVYNSSTQEELWLSPVTEIVVRTQRNPEETLLTVTLENDGQVQFIRTKMAGEIQQTCFHITRHGPIYEVRVEFKPAQMSQGQALGA